MSAPIIAPETTVIPPTTASNSTGNAESVPVSRLKSSLPTVPFHPASKKPPMPAMAAARAKTSTLVRVRSSPTVVDAAGLSFIA